MAYTKTIAASECIGDSLVKINSNFGALDNGLTTAVSNIETITEAVNNISTGLPAGFIMSYAGLVAPAGWLICNGEAIIRGSGEVQGQNGNFSALYDIVGSTLPNLQGYFIRGISGTRTPGSSQKDALKDHVHAYAYNSWGNKAIQTNDGYGGAPYYLTTSYTSTGGANTNSNETRPLNRAYHFCIKY